MKIREEKIAHLRELAEAKLCYMRDNFAYFTTQKLEDQTGDDWDDAPYEYNAGTPYEPCWHNELDVNYGNLRKNV